MSTRKADAVSRMLLGNDASTSKTLIRLYGGYSPTVANKVFDKCKEIDNQKIDIDLRPGHVLKSTFFKVAGINMNVELRRLKSNREKEGKIE